MEKIKNRFFLGLAVVLASMTASMAHELVEKVTPNFEHKIPNIPGKSLIALEVDYPPGGASIPHTHAKSSFIYAYVVEGSIESKVNNEKPKIYQAGQSWFEEPGAVHSISRNVSKTKPAKLLAVFVVDTDDKELVTPVK
ncbi:MULTISPECIES: cupin domain-containing protein [Acinetobacter]|uniref:Cupin domain-containing protein n=1 Tax=Acinetobacter geminorum TaxID=2730922 RepID=A0ABT8ZFL8_9GAMM|nr:MULTISPECIES: cupin domain-containing protein [Acinetobacter]MDO7362784.1 cupin domain-containing protein [Acinetobacter geminorum]